MDTPLYTPLHGYLGRFSTTQNLCTQEELSQDAMVCNVPMAVAWCLLHSEYCIEAIAILSCLSASSTSEYIRACSILTASWTRRLVTIRFLVNSDDTSCCSSPTGYDLGVITSSFGVDVDVDISYVFSRWVIISCLACSLNRFSSARPYQLTEVSLLGLKHTISEYFENRTVVFLLLHFFFFFEIWPRVVRRGQSTVASEDEEGLDMILDVVFNTICFSILCY